MEFKMDFTVVPHIPTVENGIRSTVEPVLPKASPGEEIEYKKLRSLKKAFKVRFLAMQQSGYGLMP